MSELIQELFLKFAFETGILHVVNENIPAIAAALLFVGFLTCFFGFFIYRGEFSVLVFVGITLLCCFIMKGRADWGAITATFSVIGVTSAFFTYRWHRCGGFIVMVLMAGTMAWAYLGASWLVTILAAAAAGALLLAFPIHTIAVVTALWGSLLIGEYSELLRIDAIYAHWILLVCFVIGTAMQLFMSKNQKLFPKIYPDRFTYWLEKRRCAG